MTNKEMIEGLAVIRYRLYTGNESYALTRPSIEVINEVITKLENEIKGEIK